MIRIKAITITNYKSCVKTNVEVKSDLTVLIGLNGAGKTNILHALMLLNTLFKGQSNSLDNLSSYYLTATIKLLVTLNDTEFIFKADINYDTTEYSSDIIMGSSVKYRENKTGKNWVKIDKSLYPEIDRFERFQRMGLLAHINQQRLDDHKDILPILLYLMRSSYYSATQFSDPAKSPISIEVDEKMPSRNIPRDRPHSKFIYDLYNCYKKDKKGYRLFEQTVNQHGIGLIDELNLAEISIPNSSHEIKAGGKIQLVERNRNFIVPQFYIDNAILSSNQLSEGTFKTLALVFYVLYDKSELLLIEEPEVCVHHGLLNSIIELIKIQSKRKQIIVSTHSDYILDKLAPENIVLISKVKGIGTIAKSLNKTLSNAAYKTLKGYLENTGNLGEYWKEGGFDNE